MADAQEFKDRIVEAVKVYAEEWEAASIRMGDKIARAIVDAAAAGIKIGEASFNESDREKLQGPIASAQARLDLAFQELEKQHGIKGEPDGRFDVL